MQFSETNPNGCLGEVNLDIVVHSLPSPSFSYEKLCVGQPINFKNTTESSSKLKYVQWEINGLVDTTYDLSRTFLNDGLYPISLSVEDEWGCTSTF